MKAHKPALLEMMATDPWPDDPLADNSWNDAIDADELDPCPKCGSLELWESMLGNWRCQQCEPPAKGWGWADLVNAT